MSNEDTDSPKDANEPKRPSLQDKIYVGVGMPEVMAHRVMRGFIIEEMLAALFQHELMTKEACHAH